MTPNTGSCLETPARSKQNHNHNTRLESPCCWTQPHPVSQSGGRNAITSSVSGESHFTKIKHKDGMGSVRVHSGTRLFFLFHAVECVSICRHTRTHAHTTSSGVCLRSLFLCWSRAWCYHHHASPLIQCWVTVIVTVELHLLITYVQLLSVTLLKSTDYRWLQKMRVKVPSLKPKAVLQHHFKAITHSSGITIKVRLWREL